jgi:hypothetical protein
MSTEENTAIDEKKNNESGSPPNWPGFFGNLLGTLAYTLIILIPLGSLALYTSKVAYSGILPTDILEEPFNKNVAQKIPNVIVEMNILKKYGFYGLNIANPLEISSQKASFLPFNGNDWSSSYSLIKSLNLNKDISMFKSFYSDVFNATVIYNNIVTNFIFNLLYNCNESFLMFFSILIYLIIFPVYVFGNFFLLLVNHFTALKNVISPPSRRFDLMIGLWYFLAFCVSLLILILFLFASAVLAPFVSVYSLVAPLFATYKLEGEKNKTFNVGSFVKDSFVYKKVLIMILLTFSLLSSTATNLGVNYLISVFVAIAICIYLNVYQTQIDSDDISQIKVLTQSISSKMGGDSREELTNMKGGNKQNNSNKAKGKYKFKFF